jgi:hypothetical protein
MVRDLALKIPKGWNYYKKRKLNQNITQNG